MMATRAVGSAVDAIDPADDRGLAHANLEGLFGVQNLRRRESSGGGKELAQLSDALLLVEFVLVRFLNLSLGQIEAEEVDEFFVGLGAPEVYGIEISLEDAMDGSAVLHRRSWPGRQTPVSVEFELQSAALVGVNGRRAETSMQTVEDRQLEPYVRLRLGWVGQRRFGEDVETCLRAARRDRGQPASEALVRDQVPHVAGRGLVDFAGSLSRIDVQ